MGFFQGIKQILNNLPGDIKAIVMIFMLLLIFIVISLVSKNLIILSLVVITITTILILALAIKYLYQRTQQANRVICILFVFLLIPIVTPNIKANEVAITYDRITREDLDVMKMEIKDEINTKNNNLETQLKQINEKMAKLEKSGTEQQESELVPILLLQLIGFIAIILYLRNTRGQ